jgi:hypothetical protein
MMRRKRVGNYSGRVRDGGTALEKFVRKKNPGNLGGHFENCKTLLNF